MLRRLHAMSMIALMVSLGWLDGRAMAGGAPDGPEQGFDQALAAIDRADYDTAVGELLKLKHRYPEDVVVRSKLIVAYAGAGNRDARDRERVDLVELRSRSTIPAIRDAEAFERDGFRVGNVRVSVIEYFDLVGERPVRYSFLVSASGSGSEERRLTLGSYARTNRYLRQRGAIGPTDRAFHLDEQTPDGHRTWSFFLKEPSYDDLRSLVVDVLEGKMQPLSQSRTP